MPELGPGIKKKEREQLRGDKVRPEKQALIPEIPPHEEEGKREKTLAEILRHRGTGLIFFNSLAQKKKAVIALLEDLSPEEQEALLPLQSLTVDLEDDLLEKVLELQQENYRLQALALVDGLTGLYNNRFFTTQLEKEMSRTRRTGLPCSLLMMDLDNFKALNDTLGHLEGNRFLISVANVLRESLRSADTICRFGGDEFTVIMPATNLYESVRVADRLLKAVQALAEPLGLGISLSAGVCEYTAASPLSLHELVHATDSALYEAKRSGKNQVTVQGKVEPTFDESGMVSVEEKEALFALKDHLQKQGEEDEV
jgi:diguanylate cyclase (GGDEF)-like protein